MNKVLQILAILLLTAGTAKAQKEDEVRIPAPVAKQIIQDLISGDRAKAELDILEKRVLLFNQRMVAVDSTVALYQTKVQTYASQVSVEKSKTQEYANQVAVLQKDNKKLKAKLVLTKSVSTIIVSSLMTLYLLK